MVKGYSYGFLYIAFVALSTIWLNRLGHNFSLAILLFYSTLVSIITFNAVTIKELRLNHRNITKSIKNWVYMSVSVLLIWYLSYFSTIHSSAGFFIPLFFLTTALLASLTEFKWSKIVACTVSIALIYYHSTNASVVVLCSSMAAGLAGFIYYRSSYKFSLEVNATVLGVLSVRFYFLFIATTIYLLVTGQAAYLRVSLEEGAVLILLGLVNMVIPVFLSQSALQILGVNKFTFVTTLIPTLTFLLEIIFGNTWQSGMFLACLCATVTLNFDVLEKVLRTLLPSTRYINERTGYIRGLFRQQP